jgi:hypothetical protein
VFEYLPFRTDVLLLLVAVTLYIVDLARLLHINELLFVTGKTGSSFRVPGNQMEIARRYLMIVRPYDPTAALLGYTWPGTVTTGVIESLHGEAFSELLDKLLVPLLICTALLPQIFLALPLLYLFGETSLPMLVMLLAIYLQILFLTLWMIIRRKRMNLKLGTCLSLCFESIICIPYAINLYRKLVAHLGPATLPDDVLATGQLLLPPAALQELKKELDSQAAEMIEQYADDVAEVQKLQAFRIRLQKSQE